jgi:gliding motility-associated-like protein
MRLYFVFLLWVLGGVKSASGQIDTVFWFAAPHTWVNTTQNFHIPVQFIVSNPNATAASVTVTMPANAGFVPILTTVPAGGVSFVNLTPFNAQIIHDVPNTVINRGLKVSSTLPVQVTYEVVSGFCECNPEIFTLKGNSGLGQLFYIPFQQSWPNDNLYTPQPVASFDIVATEDSTLVDILPSAALVGRPANVQFQVLLNRGQSYSATAATHLLGQRPSGSRVNSNKPIAITVKDDLVRPSGGFCADLAGDQLVPVASYSKEYVVIRGSLNIPDIIVIIPSVSGIPIFANGVSLGISIAGFPIYTSSTSPTTYLSSSEPFLVSHFSGFTCEIGNAIIPGVTCINGTEFQVPRRNSRAFRLQIVVPAGGQGGFRFNGAVGLFGAVTWTAVAGTANAFYYADVAVSTAQLPALQVGRVTNLTHPFIIGVLHGFHTEGARYAFYSNFGQNQPVNILSNNPDGRYCLGDTVLLTINTNDTVLWTRPSGMQFNSNRLEISSFSLADTGWYAVSGLSGCGPQIDSIYLSLIPPGQVSISLSGSDTICQGDTVQLLLSRTGAFQLVEFVDGNGNASSIQNDSIPLFNTGNYYVRWIDSCGVSDSTTALQIVVLAAQTPDIQLSGVSICDDDSIRLLIRNFSAIGTYELTIPSGASIVLTDSVRFLLASGGYSLVHIVGTCRSSVVFFNINGGVANFGNVVALPDTLLCEGDSVTLFIPQEALSYQWFLNGAIIPNETDSVLTSTGRGFFEIEVRIQNPCVDTTIRLSRLVMNRQIEAVFDANPRKGARPLSVSFTNNSIGANTYVWLINDSVFSMQRDFSFVFDFPGFYHVQLLAYDSLSGCFDSTSLQIQVLDTLLIFIPNAFTPNGDGTNERFRVYGEGFTDGILAIYNRWGQLVFETTNWEEGWDGYMNGVPAESGVYVYLFQYIPSVGEGGIRSGVLKLVK